MKWEVNVYSRRQGQRLMHDDYGLAQLYEL
jgi:hypothetical protein